MLFFYRTFALLSFICILGMLNSSAFAQDSTATSTKDTVVSSDSDIDFDDMELFNSDDWDINFRKIFGATLPAFSTLKGEHSQFSGLSYDRVDGLFIGLGSADRRSVGDDSVIFANFGFGYGFGSHYWQVQGGIDFRLQGELPWATLLGFQGYLLTDTRDEWKISTGENSVNAFFAREDHRNYYKRAGWSAHIQQVLNSKGHFTAEFRQEELSPLGRNIEWSLFGGDKVFRPNPYPNILFTKGWANVLTVSAEYEDISTEHEKTAFSGKRNALSRLRSYEVRRGYYIGGQAEFFSRDFDFERYVVDARVYVPLARLVQWNARARVHSVVGNAPMPFLATMGGVGTLQGYGMNVQTGNRSLLLQTEFIVHRLPPLSLIGLSVIFFGDAALIGNSTSDSPVQGFDNASWFSSVGIALGSSNGKFRIGMAFPLEESSPSARFVLRFSPVF